jgi:hypothetical protein
MHGGALSSSRLITGKKKLSMGEGRVVEIPGVFAAVCIVLLQAHDRWI